MQAPIGEVRADRARKFASAFAAAKATRPDYIMFLDMDDFVARDLGALLMEAQGGRGFFFRSGFIWDWASGETGLVRRDFHRRCGSSHLLRTSLLEGPPVGVPRCIDEDGRERRIDPEKAHLGGISSGEDPFEALDANYLLYILGSHRWIGVYYGLAEWNRPQVIWNWNTGENWICHRSGDLNGLIPAWDRFLPPPFMEPRPLLEAWRQPWD